MLSVGLLPGIVHLEPSLPLQITRTALTRFFLDIVSSALSRSLLTFIVLYLKITSWITTTAIVRGLT